MKHGRKFHEPAHIEAGYHEKDWGPIPTSRDEIIGTYETPQGGVIAVRYLEKGPSGNPELELEWDDGAMVTVLDEACAWEYLYSERAVKRGRG